MRRISIRLIAAIGLALAVGAGLISPAAAETKTLEWLRLDTDVTVQPNGDLNIVETNVINFTSGTFTFGYRDIDTSRLDGVTVQEVRDDSGQPLQYETSQSGSTFRIKYYFEPARKVQRTIVLFYAIRGAVRYYSGGDQVYWAGVYADRNGYSVQSSKLTVTLPPGATADKAESTGPRAKVTGQGESVVVAEASEPIPSGEQFEIRVQFPHGIVTGQPAAWQADFDRQRAFAETTKPVINLVVLLISLLILFGGPALVVLLWYTRGRDPDVGLVADYLNEPPAGMTPGVAGTLGDEKADLQDVIATLVDLARRGVLNLEETGSKNKAGLVVNSGYDFSRGPNFGAPLSPYEQKLMDAVGLAANETASLSSLRNRFYNRIGGIYGAMYEQLVADGYYQRRPDQVRGAYAGLASLFLVLTIVFGCAGTAFLSDYTDLGFLLAAGLGVTTITLYIVSGHMPVRTRKGAEANMRLQAFRRYLQNVEKYTDLKTATDLFDKYLPYAIAFGLDRSWVQKFSTVDTPAPGWYIPYGVGRRYGVGRSMPGAGGKGLSDVSDAARAPGGLSGLDRGLTSGLSNISAGLTGMFSSVASTFVSQPAPSSSGGRSGGWSGGGGFSGGSSGGGGGGFG